MKKKQFDQTFKYYLGQSFQKNDPDVSFPQYLIQELRYSAEPWAQDRITIHIDGDYGRLSFQGGLDHPLQEIVFQELNTGKLITRSFKYIDKLRENNQLIF